MDAANTFVENERQIWETQWAMGNVEFVSEEHKIFSFFWQKLAWKIFLAKTITSRRPSEWCTIGLGQNINILKLTVKTGLKNIPFAL